jgi:hypothetical protein
MGNDSDEEKLSDELIDATLADSFPASDPPSWTLGRERRRRLSGTESASKPAEPPTSTVEPKDKAEN